MMTLILVTDNKRSVHQFIEEKKKVEGSLVINITPQALEYSIHQIKEITKELIVSTPYKRIYLFEEFNRSSLEAQNAFLKLLEEPPANTQFILTVATIYQLIPTIVSRAKIIYLDKKQSVLVDKQFKKEMLNITQINDKIFGDNLSTENWLMQLISFFRERLTLDKQAITILKEILSVKLLVENNNLNQQLAFDHLLIFIKKAYTIKE